MDKLLYITNIPTPYRQFRFNLLSKLLQQNGIELEVLYMAKSEPNRNWRISECSYNYNYKIYKGFHPLLFGIFAHFNPMLLIRLLKNDYKYAIIGGLASPTHWLCPFFISKQKIKIMSVESNLFSLKRDKNLAFKIKKNLLLKVDAYQVTGSPQLDYIKRFTGKIDRPIIRLPNLIDDKVFLDKISELNKYKDKMRSKFKIMSNEQVWVIPARLHVDKGLMEFLKILSTIKDLSNIKIYILGTRTLKDKIKNFIKKYNLPIILIGHVEQDVMIKYYSISNLFVLPSIKDPSPLSPIEACAAGLPLLVSNRIGNLNDVLYENGWSFNPFGSKNDLKRLIKKIANYSNEKLSKTGLKSIKIYKKNFDNTKCLNNYINSILEI